ncbi:MAG: hypothetical protein ACR2PZ_00755 [Pseudomonadales bacterium]
MQTEKLNTWLSLVANFGVIAGLLFLGYEIRQNTTQLRSEASYSMNAAISLINSGVYNDAVFADIKVRGEADFSSLNPTERQQFIAFQFDRINLAIHYRALLDEGLSDIHFPYDRFLINDFHRNPGLQQFLEAVEDTWVGEPELYEELRKD